MRASRRPSEGMKPSCRAGRSGMSFRDTGPRPGRMTKDAQMTSILTNTSAMVALQTLRDINTRLDTTNDRVSTGLRIANAEDSAAFWAIATTTRSDNGALSAVEDALGLGRTTVDVAYQGLEAARDGLQQIKELLVSARSPGVDRANIQTQIDGILNDLQTKASASVINEQNWLEVDTSAAGYNANKEVVGSFERPANGSVTVGTIDLDITNIVLVDNNATAASKVGILDQQRNADGDGDGTDELTAQTVLDLSGTTVSALTESAGDLTELDAWIVLVDNALTETITAQNEVGVTLSRIDSQMEFVKSLVDANDRAIGTLVDADMEEESTKLRALQTQQQLAVQSLSIANGAAQNILQLFRG
jgi:flagellin